MSSEGRYLYHQTPPGMSASYDYSSYPPTYDSGGQMQPQSSMRSMRPSTTSTSAPTTNSSQPHSSPHHPSSSGFPPPTHPSYHSTTYGPPTYPVGPPTHSWSPEGWSSHYPPPFPPAPIAEAPFNSGPGRPDVAPHPSSDSRSFAPPSHPRHDERSLMQVGQPPPPAPKGRRRDKDVPPSGQTPASPLDFPKLQEYYRHLIDSGASLGAAGPSRTTAPLETVERMLSSATHCFRAFQSAMVQPTPPTPPPPPPPPPEVQTPNSNSNNNERGSEEPRVDGANGSSPPKRPKSDEAAQEGQLCMGCDATSTPEWRRGPMGPRTLCNACGLVYAKLIKKRVREGNRASNGDGSSAAAGVAARLHPDESGHISSGSDDDLDGDDDGDDSPGSPGRQSDFGDHGHGHHHHHRD